MHHLLSITYLLFQNGSIAALLFGMNITVKFYDAAGDEVSAVLPAKHVVCSRCEGHGTHLNPSIGNHAYSMEEFQESFDEEGQQEYFRRGGMYDVTCHECKGKNVVLVVDEENCRTAQQKADLASYNEAEEAQYEADREAAAERRWEEGAMGNYDDM